MFIFEELDALTRNWMLREFDKEERENPYRSQRLSDLGVRVFPELMRKAIQIANEDSLMDWLSCPDYWKAKEIYYKNGVPYERRINPLKAAQALAYTEFNTWYVRGFSARLLSEGVQECEVYRAAPAWEPRLECLEHEGKIYPVRLIYEGHRARYWPAPGEPSAFMIPAGTNCHHSIRRICK